METPDKPAFPIINSDGYATNFDLLQGEDAGAIGLTKREYFAALAMQGLLGNPYNNSNTIAFLAELAIKSSDELLKQLEK